MWKLKSSPEVIYEYIAFQEKHVWLYKTNNALLPSGFGLFRYGPQKADMIVNDVLVPMRYQAICNRPADPPLVTQD